MKTEQELFLSLTETPAERQERERTQPWICEIDAKINDTNIKFKCLVPYHASDYNIETAFVYFLKKIGGDDMYVTYFKNERSYPAGVGKTLEESEGMVDVDLRHYIHALY
jgi:hypothetical protein